MLVLFSLLLLIVDTTAQNTAECNENAVFETTLTPSPNGTEGRYTVKWCPSAEYISPKRKIVEASLWSLQIFYDNRTQAKCKETTLYREPRVKHSVVSQQLDLHGNCSNVCFYKEMDLIVTGCYFVKNMLQWSNHKSESDETYHYISNNIKSVDHFIKNTPLVRSKSYGEEVHLLWYFGYLPVSEYMVDFCKNDTTECREVRESCSEVRPHVVQCAVRAAPGCYRALLTHLAPWTHARQLWGSLAHTDIYLCHTEESLDDDALTQEWSSKWSWWAGMLAVGALAAFAGLAVRSWRREGRGRGRGAADKEGVLKAWVMGRHKELSDVLAPRPSPPAPPPPAADDILLVYARDGGPAPRVFNALYKLLQTTTEGKVYDLHSAETAGLSAGLGAEWLRGQLARRDLRVVLLQTPAALCLYRHNNSTNLLSRALVGGDARYRRARCSDALCVAALRLLRDAAVRTNVYRNYYVAQIISLETEVVPQVAPFRRYLIPDGVGVLLQDLSQHPLTQHPDVKALTEELHSATDDFLQYVRENENYLRDELFFL